MRRSRRGFNAWPASIRTFSAPAPSSNPKSSTRTAHTCSRSWPKKAPSRPAPRQRLSELVGKDHGNDPAAWPTTK